MGEYLKRPFTKKINIQPKSNEWMSNVTCHQGMQMRTTGTSLRPARIKVTTSGCGEWRGQTPPGPTAAQNRPWAAADTWLLQEKLGVQMQQLHSVRSWVFTCNAHLRLSPHAFLFGGTVRCVTPSGGSTCAVSKEIRRKNGLALSW